MEDKIIDGNYIIIHDIKGEDYKDGYLYRVCGSSLLKAQASLDDLINNPDQYTKADIEKGYCNFRLKEVPMKDCWWNDPSWG